MTIEHIDSTAHLPAAGNLSIRNGSLLLGVLPLLPMLSGNIEVRWLGYVGLLISFLILFKAPLRRQRRSEFGKIHFFFLLRGFFILLIQINTPVIGNEVATRQPIK